MNELASGRQSGEPKPGQPRQFRQTSARREVAIISLAAPPVGLASLLRNIALTS